MKAKILIVDDHDIVREGVRTLIMRSRPDWQICGEARNSQEAINSVESLRPNVVILDITMPGMSGLDVAPRILNIRSECRIVIFTMHESASLDEEVRNTGAHGYVLKSQASRNLILAIETILSGGTFYGAPAMPEDNRSDKPGPGMAFWRIPTFDGA